MGARKKPVDYPRIPLTRFHIKAGEFLDLARKTPIVLTSHGRECHILADSSYFRHLEEMAGRRIAQFMDLQAISTADMTDGDQAAFEASRPTPQELANDEWAS